MSWVSSFIQRNGHALQAVAKPLISNIPVVGPQVSSRILMSPTPAQASAIEATSTAVSQLSRAATAVRDEDAAARIAQPRDTVALTAPPPAIAASGGLRIDSKTAMIAGLVVLALAVVFLLARRK